MSFNKGIIRRYNTFTYSSSDTFNLTWNIGSVIFIVTDNLNL